MSKIYTNNYPFLNLYKKPQAKSEIVTQIIYGESFKILQTSKKWLKIKIKEDGYIGFIKRKNFFYHITPTHKVSSLSANTYKKPALKNKIGKLPYLSKIRVVQKFSKFSKFNNQWIESRCIKPINYKNKNYFKDIKIFKNVKYKWGGKTFDGIDCSALVQVQLNFNNKFCPRDTSQQVKYFKKNITLKKIKTNDVIYWKGHVAVAISKKKLIHAYGPRKKTVIMDIKKTIKLIKKTANLDLISIKRIA